MKSKGNRVIEFKTNREKAFINNTNLEPSDEVADVAFKA